MRHKLSKKRENKFYAAWDIMPFGKYKGNTMAYIARTNPEYLEWYRTKHRVQYSATLTEIIKTSKFLSA